MGKKKGKKKSTATVAEQNPDGEEIEETEEGGVEGETPAVVVENSTTVEGEEEEEEEQGEKKESRGQILQRHKREIKELKIQTQAMLHSFAKNDKKAKQETTAKIKQMEDDLKKKQDTELADFDNKQKAQEKPKEAPKPNPDAPQKKSRTQKKREEKIREEQEREKRIFEEKKNTVSQRVVELTALKKKLIPLNLDIKEIAPDGNCLYNAIADQLDLVGKMKNQKENFKQLRKITADYILAHPDDFMPFIDMEHPDVFKQYCEKVRNTNEWGGQLEIRAMCHALKVGVVIHMADSRAPDVKMGEEYGEPFLHLAFHQFAYALGEHYNSVVPIVKKEEDDFEGEEEHGDDDDDDS